MTAHEADTIHRHGLNKGTWDPKYTAAEYDLALDILTGRKPASDSVSFQAPVYGSWFISDRD
jgi:hypothetical protein